MLDVAKQTAARDKEGLFDGYLNECLRQSMAILHADVLLSDGFTAVSYNPTCFACQNDFFTNMFSLSRQRIHL